MSVTIFSSKLTIEYTTYLHSELTNNLKGDNVNTLRPRQNGRHFPDDIIKCIFLNENIWISIKILLKFVSMDPVNKIISLVQVMVWLRPGDKPLSEPMTRHVV